MGIKGQVSFLPYPYATDGVEHECLEEAGQDSDIRTPNLPPLPTSHSFFKVAQKSQIDFSRRAGYLDSGYSGQMFITTAAREQSLVGACPTPMTMPPSL